MNELTHLDTYSGIGGFSVAFEAEGFRTIGFSEIDPDKCLVLQHWWPDVPQLGAVEGITAEQLGIAPGCLDVLTGGVPCQPASALGQMRGTADERWQWPVATGLVSRLRPKFAVFENPPSLLILEDGRAWNGIVSGFCALGYDLWWDVFPAAAFGAGHLRERVIIVATDSLRSGRGEGSARGFTGDNSRATEQALPVGGARLVNFDSRGKTIYEPIPANTDIARLEGHAGNGENSDGRPGARRPVTPQDLRGRVTGADWWHEARTGIPVLVNGLHSRLVESASRCAGDSIVPQIVRPIAAAIRQQLTGELK